MDGLRFWNIAEMRYFMKYVDKRIKTSLITEELWNEAKQSTYSAYTGSRSLAYVKRCIEQFEQTNSVKYLSDFKEFVFESSVMISSGMPGCRWSVKYLAPFKLLNKLPFVCMNSRFFARVIPT